MLSYITYINIYLDFVKNKFSRFIPFKYYVIDWNHLNNESKLIDVSILINILKLFYINENKFVHKFIKNFFAINLDSNILKINNDDQVLLDYKKRLIPVIPKNIIENIRLDIINHRYYLYNLKKNLFKIDKDTPIIFCLAYYEKISKLDKCNLTLKYMLKDNSFKEITIKINEKDTINSIIKNT